MKIIPEKDGEEARVEVRWHPPMHAATGIRTHRVDIGLFAGAGVAWSAPAFVSIYMLPNEMRFFDEKDAWRRCWARLAILSWAFLPPAGMIIGSRYSGSLASSTIPCPVILLSSA